jgi:hypothetical protein
MPPGLHRAVDWVCFIEYFWPTLFVFAIGNSISNTYQARRYLHTHTRTCTHTHVYAHTYTHKHTHMHTHVHTHTHTHTHTHSERERERHTHAQTRTHAHTHTFTHMYTHAHTDTHTHTHIHTYTASRPYGNTSMYIALLWPVIYSIYLSISLLTHYLLDMSSNAPYRHATYWVGFFPGEISFINRHV